MAQFSTLELELTNIQELKEALEISQKFLILMQENIVKLQESIDLATKIEVRFKLKIPNLL